MTQLRLSLIIPAYNEEHRLPETLRSLGAWNDPRLTEVIIVDDGSSDRTVAVAHHTSLPQLHVIELGANRGKGAAVRAGVQKATGDVIMFYDADGATPPADMSLLLDAYDADRAPVVIGSRVLSHAVESMACHRRITGWIFHALCAPLLPGIADASCGCKLFRADLLQELCREQRINRFAFDIELLLLARLHGAAIKEVPVRWTAVQDSKVFILRDGPEMLLRVIGLYVRKISYRPKT